jgi:hypothetical protein
MKRGRKSRLECEQTKALITRLIKCDTPVKVIADEIGTNTIRVYKYAYALGFTRFYVTAKERKAVLKMRAESN